MTLRNDSEPECTCPVPRPGAMDVGYNPGCYYHGEQGTMVLTVPASLGRTSPRSKRRIGPDSQVAVSDVRDWLVNLQEQGYLLTWVADAFEREFEARTIALLGEQP